jgi:hypothetical protein
MNDTAQTSINAPIPVLYDETHHGKWYMQPRVDGVGSLPNLMGYLEHHAPNTDGSFGICIAGGNVNLVSKVREERFRLTRKISPQIICIHRNCMNRSLNNIVLPSKPGIAKT